MRTIRQFAMCFMALAAAAGFVSCDDDDYNYDEFPINRPNAIVTVKPGAENSSFILQLDDTTRLIPENMAASPYGNKEVRALVNYSVRTNPEGKREYGVWVNWIDSILTKKTAPNRRDENSKVYGDTPVEIVDSWETVAEDGYLTIRFRTKWSGRVAHRVNLVHRDDVNTPLLFQFYHSSEKDWGTQVGDGLVAFRLPEELKEVWQDNPIILQWNSYSGTKTVSFKYPGHAKIENG